MGPVKNDTHLQLSDASWNEKFAAGILIVGIVAIGVAPFWLNDLITPGTETIMQSVARELTEK
jgi:NADH-quinone oxidoreductase subunit M